MPVTSKPVKWILQAMRSPKKQRPPYVFDDSTHQQEVFGAKKDSLGMVMAIGVNCNTCHRGEAHPEVKEPEEHHGPGGLPPPAPVPPASGKCTALLIVNTFD